MALNIITLGVLIYFFSIFGSLERFHMILLQSLPFIMTLSVTKKTHGKIFGGITLAVNGLAFLGGLTLLIGQDQEDDFLIFFLFVLMPFVLVAFLNSIYVYREIKT